MPVQHVLGIDTPGINDLLRVCFLSDIVKPDLELHAVVTLQNDVLICHRENIVAHTEPSRHVICELPLHLRQIAIYWLFFSEFLDVSTLIVALEPVVLWLSLLLLSQLVLIFVT